MSGFADSSYLFALYAPFRELRSASRLFDDADQIVVTPLVNFEFEQAVWLQVFLEEQGDPNGLRRQVAEAMLAEYQADLDANRFALVSVDLERVLRDASRLTWSYTPRHGIRAMDILHLAAARQLGCAEFLTFDKLQRKVAELEGFTVPL